MMSLRSIMDTLVDADPELRKKIKADFSKLVADMLTYFQNGLVYDERDILASAAHRPG